jgi:hypothetical protein
MSVPLICPTCNVIHFSTEAEEKEARNFIRFETGGFHYSTQRTEIHDGCYKGCHSVLVQLRSRPFWAAVGFRKGAIISILTFLISLAVKQFVPLAWAGLIVGVTILSSCAGFFLTVRGAKSKRMPAPAFAKGSKAFGCGIAFLLFSLIGLILVIHILLSPATQTH